ncbi:hypothetical protein ABBQ32_004993 [Trebouxia sp. C0010 RCD-2024]
MAHMLSLTASCVTRPTLTAKTSRVCSATLRSRGINGQVLTPRVRPTRRTAPVQVVHAASRAREADIEDSAKGFLANKDQQKTAYGLLAVVWGIVAAAKIFATQQFFQHVFAAAPSAGLLGLQKLAGFSSLAPAVAAYTLAKAARGGRLDSQTYLRQNLGLAVAGTMTLIYLWKTPATVMEPIYQKLATGLAAFTAIVGGAVYSQTSGHKFNLSKIAEGFGNSVAALLSPENTNAGIYSFLSAGLGLYSLVLLFGSHELAAQWLFIGSGQVSLFLQREIGLSAFLAAIQTYCLKDAADRGRIGKSTFKNLNLSLAVIAVGNAASLWYAASHEAMWTTQNYIRLAFLALQVITFSYNWIESDRDESEDVNKIERAFDDATDGLRDVLSKGEREAKKLLNKGEDAADDVKHKGKKYADKAEDKAEDLGDKAQDKWGEAKHEGKKYANKAEDEAGDLGDKAKGQAKDTKREADRWGDKAGDKSEDLGDKARNAARNTERKADKWGDKAENKAEDLGDKAKGAAKDTEREADRLGNKAEGEAKDAGRDGKGLFGRRR